MFRARMGRPRRATWVARGLDAMHPDRMHMHRHHSSHQRQQGQSDATVARGCAHQPIIRPSAPAGDMAELGRQQLSLGWDRGPSPAQRTSISATTDLNRQIVYVSARASPPFLNSPSLEAFGRSGPGARTNAAALSLLGTDLPSKITLSNRNTVLAENGFGDRDVRVIAHAAPCPPNPAPVGGLGGSRPDASRHGGQGRHLTGPHSWPQMHSPRP